MRESSVRATDIVTVCWSELESQLYKLFLERRKKGQAIRWSWFQINAMFLFRQLYEGEASRSDLGEGSMGEIFRFSNGWFH